MAERRATLRGLFRLKPAGPAIPLDDVEWAVKELNRIADKGLRGAAIPCLLAADRSFGETRFDPFWAAAQERGIPLSLHVNTYEGAPPFKSPEYLVDYAGFLMQIMAAVAQFIATGVLQRFPALKLVSVENDIGWIASYLQRCDQVYSRYSILDDKKFKSGRTPTEVCRQHVYHTFTRDRAGIKTYELWGGLPNIMWASDYPHGDSSYPASPQMVEAQVGDLPQDHQDRILRTNVLDLYDWH